MLISYLKYNHHLVPEGVILETAIELLRRLNEPAVDLVVEPKQEAHGMEHDLRVVRKHVAVHVQHDRSIGEHRGHPCLHKDETVSLNPWVTEL